jgi:hypothetical protein
MGSSNPNHFQIFTMKNMKNMKNTKKKRNQDACLRFGRVAVGLLHLLPALHGEKKFMNPSGRMTIWR